MPMCLSVYERQFLSSDQLSHNVYYSKTPLVKCCLISLILTMEKTLAISNVVLGTIIFLFHDPESAIVGICGGIYLVVIGLLLITSKLKNKVVTIGLGIKAALIGIPFISIYSRSLDSYQGLLDDCQLIATIIYGLKQCDRIAWDPIMVVLGCLIIIVNLLIITHLLLSTNAFISKNNVNSKAII